MKSVSWIERFAGRRRSARRTRCRYARASPEVPRRAAPAGAPGGALGQHGPAGGVISTESSRSILESVATRIDEARDITRYTLRTFDFPWASGHVLRACHHRAGGRRHHSRAGAHGDGEPGSRVFDKLMTGLESQLGGMATAFSSSLLGLAGSLVVGLLELFVTHGQNRFYRELEEWMSGFTRIGLGGAEGQGLGEAALAGFAERDAGAACGFCRISTGNATNCAIRRLRPPTGARCRWRRGVEGWRHSMAPTATSFAASLSAERQAATAQALAGLDGAISGLAQAQSREPVALIRARWSGWPRGRRGWWRCPNRVALIRR